MKKGKWHGESAVDEFGNVACNVCGHEQSPVWRACVACCAHNTLTLIESWHGPDDGGGWEIDAECKQCGWNQFGREELIERYKMVRLS